MHSSGTRIDRGRGGEGDGGGDVWPRWGVGVVMSDPGGEGVGMVMSDPGGGGGGGGDVWLRWGGGVP